MASEIASQSAPATKSAQFKEATVGVGKAIGILMLTGIPLRVLGLVSSLVPAVGSVVFVLQLVVALVALVLADSMIPLWVKERIPVMRFGASRRAETYAKWYAWYSLK